MKRLQGFILGVLVTLIVVASIPSFADSITVVINGINITLNGKKIAGINDQFTLDNGSTVPYSILYKGTTYLPMKKLAELLNKEITWDNLTKTAGIYDRGMVPITLPSEKITFMKAFATKIMGKFYNYSPSGEYSTFVSLYYSTSGKVYAKKDYLREFDLVLLYISCLANNDNYAVYSNSNNPILDGSFKIDSSVGSKYYEWNVSYEYEGLIKSQIGTYTLRSLDLTKTATVKIKDGQLISILGSDGANLVKFVTIDNVEYIDLIYLLNYLGFDGKAYFDTTKNFDVFEPIK